MSCSKEVRIPSDWAFQQKEVLKEEIDLELYNVDGLVKWLIETEAGDESTIREYVKVIKPYRFGRCIYPIVPNNRLCRETFQVFMHSTIGLYLIDDMMEKECDHGEMEKICSEYDKLDEELCKIIPKIPALQDLKTLLKFLPRKLRGPILTCMDMVNRVTAHLLRDGNSSEDVVFNFRRLLSNQMSIFLKGVQCEKKATVEITENEVLWSRITAGGPLILSPYVEISSSALGKTKEHSQTVVEMYVASSLLCIITNDLYSIHRETINAIPGDNVIGLWLRKKEITSLPEAVIRCTKIVNVIIQYMYKKVKNVKIQYPDNPEVHTLFLHIAQTAIGWIFFHEKASGRYQDSPWRLSLADVKEDEVEQWLEDKDSYGVGILNQFLATNAKAKKIIDALLGSISDITAEILCDNR